MTRATLGDVRDRLTAITDPATRVRRAAAEAAKAQARADQWRPKRDTAGLVLHLRHNWTAADTYRAMGVNRNRFRGIRDDAPDTLPRMARADAEKQLTKAAEIVASSTELAEMARTVRDETASEMMNVGGYSNADIARLTGLTSARAAQIRKGTR